MLTGKTENEKYLLDRYAVAYIYKSQRVIPIVSLSYLTKFY